jgi:hypothetical protein
LSQQEGAKTVKKPRPVNVLFIAMASGALHLAVGVIFVPFLSMLMLSFGAQSVAGHTLISAEQGMVFAVTAPFLYGAAGFGGGALMAFLFNRFVAALDRSHPAVKIVVEAAIETQAATVGDAA